MKLIRRSLENAWRYRFLWLFGFFAAAGDDYTSAMFSWDEEDGSWGGILHGLGIDPAYLVMAVIVGFALWILFWVLSVLSEGALIYGIFRREQNLSAEFGDAFDYGVQKFPRLFGIMLLATVGIVAAVMALIVLVVPGFIVALPLGILLAIIGLPALVAIILVIVCVECWAVRFAVIQDTPWLESVRLGWQLFARNVGRSLAVAFSSFFTRIVIGCGLIVVALILALPFVLIALGDWKSALVPGVFVAVAYVALSLAYLGTFASSVWTLGYMQLLGYPVKDS